MYKVLRLFFLALDGGHGGLVPISERCSENKAWMNTHTHTLITLLFSCSLKINKHLWMRTFSVEIILFRCCKNSQLLFSFYNWKLQILPLTMKLCTPNDNQYVCVVSLAVRGRLLCLLPDLQLSVLASSWSVPRGFQVCHQFCILLSWTLDFTLDISPFVFNLPASVCLQFGSVMICNESAARATYFMWIVTLLPLGQWCLVLVGDQRQDSWGCSLSCSSWFIQLRVTWILAWLRRVLIQ